MNNHRDLRIFLTILISLVIIFTSRCARRPADPEVLLRERCTRCHTLAPIQGARKSPEEWEKTVQRMRSKGAILTDEEARIIIQYLSRKGGQP